MLRITVIAAALMMTSSAAFGANRTVCFELKIHDERDKCPTVGTIAARRGCNPGGDASTKGHFYELWDKDSGDSSNDEYIGTWWRGGTGVRCASFEWENANYANGEDDPDVYLTYYNTVSAGTNGITITGVKGDGSSYPDTSWRDGDGFDDDAFVAVNCQAGVDCYLAQGYFLPTSNPATNRSLMLMTIDSAVRAMEVFAGHINKTNKDIDIYVDQDADLPTSCPTACQINQKKIYMPANLAHEGDRATHEIGHVLQARELSRASVRDDCSRNGNGWSPTSKEHDSCATQEGFASYVATRAWYNASNVAVAPKFQNFDIEEPVPWLDVCIPSAGRALQVAKAFWDLDDTNNEAGAGIASGDDDVRDKTAGFILDEWDDFLSGTANRKDNESGQDGVNMWDFRENNGTNIETFIDHNCLREQDFN